MDTAQQLGTGSVARLLWNFSLPAIVGMVVSALYNIVDRIFVGHGVGLLGISATTVAFPISIIILAFGLLIGIGAAATISIKLGQGKHVEAEQILGNALISSILISIFVTVLGLAFEEPLLRAFGASSEVLPLAKEFVTIIIAGTVLQLIGLALNNIIRAEGNPRLAMVTMLIGAVLNAIFNPFFIFVLHLGIRGSALATIVSSTVSSAWVVAYFIGKKSLLKLKFENLRLRWTVVGQILAIGMAPFLFQLVASIITVAFNLSLESYGGDVAIAAMGIINSVSMLILMPVIGINQGAKPIIGYNYGAGQLARVKKTLELAILGATAVTAGGFILVQLFPGAIMSIFAGPDKALLEIGIPGLRIFLMMLPIIGFQVVSSNYYQAIGKATASILLTLSRQVIFLLPALLILPRFFKVPGIWAAGPVADFLASILTAVFILRELHRIQEVGR